MANAVGSVFDPGASLKTIAGTSRVPMSNTGSDGVGYQTISGVMTYVNANASISAVTQLTGALAAANFPALTGDITTSAGSLTTAIAAGVIVNADVNASAAIALTKLAAATASRALVSDGSGFIVPATTTATEIGYVNGVTSAIQTQLNGKASVTQTAEGAATNIGGALADGDYRMYINMPHGGTITETTTRSTAGTATATYKINTTALGGTANSVSTSEQAQSHASSNTFSAGDDIVITISANSGCQNLTGMIKYTRTLS